MSRLADGICPPRMLALLNAVRLRIRPPLSGLTSVYPDWESAVGMATGYDTMLIRNAVVDAAEQAASSDGLLFDRDGYVFHTPITPLPLVACLLKAASRSSGRLTVFDFGGALGATYRQCLPFLSGLSLRWVVVEQPAIVEIGRARFATQELQFALTLQEAMLREIPDAVVLSGVLQYVDDPYDILRNVVALKPKTIVIDRNPFSKLENDTFTLQVVQKELFPARLPFRIFGTCTIEDALLPGYRAFARFSAVDPVMRAGHIRVEFLGKAFEPISGGS